MDIQVRARDTRDILFERSFQQLDVVQIPDAFGAAEIGLDDLLKQSQSVTGSASFYPKLTKPGYFTTPPMDILLQMTETELKSVEGFSVFNPFGKVEFLELTDITFQDLDAAVIIKQGSIEVYPDQHGEAYHLLKPEQGTKLNKPAKLSYYRMTLSSYNQTARQALKIGAKLVDYLPHARTLAVRVEHFTKFEFVADESDGEDVVRNDDIQPRKDRSAILKPESQDQPVMRSFTLPILPGRTMDIEQHSQTNPVTSTFRDLLFTNREVSDPSQMFRVTINNEGSTTNAMLEVGGPNFDIKKVNVAERFKSASGDKTQDLADKHPFDLDFEQIDDILAEMASVENLGQSNLSTGRLTDREQELADRAERHIIE